MFPKEIVKDKVEQFYYGKTKVDAASSLMEIQKLLRKHGCERIMTDYQKIDDKEYTYIYFAFKNKPYMITIPRCYAWKGVQHRPNAKKTLTFLPDTGARTAFHFIKNLLQIADDGVPVETLFLPARMIRDPDTDLPTTLGEKHEDLIKLHKIELLGPGGG